MKRVKNNTDSAQTWCGMEIQPGVYYTLQSGEENKWADDSVFLGALTDGAALMNDGTNDITDPALGINFLKDITVSDSDGAPQMRMKMATLGSKYLGDCFEFLTSDLDSVEHKKFDGTNMNFVTLKLFDANDAEITDPANEGNAVKTQVDWEPTHNYEIIGGSAWALDQPTVDVRCWALAAPDIPAQYGGCVEFLRNCNFRLLGSKHFTHDGRVAKQMYYNAQNHQGKFRFIFRHPAGHQSYFMVEMEIFRL